MSTEPIPGMSCSCSQDSEGRPVELCGQHIRAFLAFELERANMRAAEGPEAAWAIDELNRKVREKLEADPPVAYPDSQKTRQNVGFLETDTERRYQEAVKWQRIQAISFMAAEIFAHIQADFTDPMGTVHSVKMALMILQETEKQVAVHPIRKWEEE